MKKGPEGLGNNPQEEPKKNERSSEYLKSKQEAIDAAKKMEAELASKMEKHERHDIFSDSGEFPQKNTEKPENSEKSDLERAFTPIATDHIRYTFLQKQFPNFIRVCEESRMGESFSRDILALAVGSAQSLAETVVWVGDMAVDIGEVIIRPRAAFQRTKNMIS